MCKNFIALLPATAKKTAKGPSYNALILYIIYIITIRPRLPDILQVCKAYINPSGLDPVKNVDPDEKMFRIRDTAAANKAQIYHCCSHS